MDIRKVCIISLGHLSCDVNGGALPTLLPYLAEDEGSVGTQLNVAHTSATPIGMKVWAMHDDSSASDWPEICHLADGVLFDFHDAPRVL